MSTQEKTTPDIETLIQAALDHGLDSEPDHEAGDLQNYLRDGWSLLTDDQRKSFLDQPRVKSAMEAAAGKELKVTKALLKDDGLEKLLSIAEKHGNDEGAEVEITDLQDMLRSCWVELTVDQRTSFLELESVQETFENATLHPLFDVDPGVETAESSRG